MTDPELAAQPGAPLIYDDVPNNVALDYHYGDADAVNAAFAKAAVARGLKVAVGTAGDRHNIEFAMSRLKMDPLPLAIVGGDEGFTGKPTPAIFLEAARRIGVAPERCVSAAQIVHGAKCVWMIWAELDLLQGESFFINFAGVGLTVKAC